MGNVISIFQSDDDFMSDDYRSEPIAKVDDVKKVKSTAIRHLARREYSRLELYRKLSQLFSSTDLIHEVLDDLQEQGYQSDERFTEMYIRSRVNSGNGPFKIKIELREKGVCESTVLSAFDRQSLDWLSIAEKVSVKRFGHLPQLDPNELAKQVRYLKNKGFYQEHINAVVKHCN